ncbi:YheU family protein [Aurantivibrio plasticivorans]
MLLVDMIIPYDRLPSDTLDSVIESVVHREGTDYGQEEVDLSTKIDQVKAQLRRGELVLVFDGLSESINILTKQDAQQFLVEISQAKTSGDTDDY